MDELGIPSDPSAGLNLVGALRSATPRKIDPQTDKAVQVAKDFEGMLIQRLLEAMKGTIPGGGLLDSPQTQQMQDLFWMYLGQDMADKGGFGMWKDIYRQVNHGEPPPANVEIQR
jgi:peptidoglycan hydrolase FlgJ